jgi:hypothetical protein
MPTYKWYALAVRGLQGLDSLDDLSSQRGVKETIFMAAADNDRCVFTTFGLADNLLASSI